jgi:hypothetical protein
MSVRRRAAGLLCGTLAIGSAASAQSRQFFSVQASGLLASLHGNAFDLLRIGTGLGGEFQVRVNPSRFSVGAGFQLTKHSSSSQGLTNKMTLTGFFLEPRYAIPIASRVVAPYLAGRLAFLKQKTDLQDIGTTFKVKANAVAFGGGGGFVARLSNSIGFDLGVALTSSDFGKFSYRDSGADSGLDAGSGLTYVVKAGLNIGLGKR